MKKNIVIIFTISIILLLTASCNIEDENDLIKDRFPVTMQEIAEAVANTNQIAEEGGDIIENAISNAYNTNDFIDPEHIAAQLRNIENVVSAEPTSTGTGIVIKQDDGTYTNLLVVTQNDERFFLENEKKSVTLKSNNIMMFKENPVWPNGKGKALILAPFNSSMWTNLNQMSKLFESIGFTVDIYKNKDAKLQYFNGDFLDDYDIVFINTHGAANFKTRGGYNTTIFLTGEEYSSNVINSLTSEEQKAIATGGHGRKSYFAISTQWLKITSKDHFPNSWIYTGACESAMIDQGDASMSETFLNLGAIGYNGFDESINTVLANAILEKMVARFTSGLSFTNASNEVLTDKGLLNKAWRLRLLYKDDPIWVGLFDFNKKISDPFYLIDPDEVVGVAKVIPDAGPVGTDVVYQVVINDKYVSQVASIEFDIDNTGEHLDMEKINTNTWQRVGLRAPTADTYPRIDTFTFSAFDEDGNLIGQGSATFSILEDDTTKSTNLNKHKYYAQ